MNATRAARRARGECIDCGVPAKSSRCDGCGDKWRKYKQDYRASIKAGSRAEPPAEAGKTCGHCGAPCQNRFCSQACYRNSGAMAAAGVKGAASRRRARSRANPHQNYSLGVSNREYARRMLCPCRSCKAARAEDPAAHAAFVARVAAEMGVPLATGPAPKPVMAMNRDEWNTHFGAVREAQRDHRRTTELRT